MPAFHEEYAGAREPGQVLAVGAEDATVTLERGRVYRLVSSVDCYVRVGAEADAEGGMLLAAGIPERIALAGASEAADPVLHAVAADTSGDLHISPLTLCPLV